MMMVTRTADITILAADPAVWGVKIVISAVLVTIIIDSSDITHHVIVKHHPDDRNMLYRTEIDNYGVDISYIRVLTPGTVLECCSRPSPKTMPNDKTDVDSSDLKHVGKPVRWSNGLGNFILGVAHAIQSILTRSQTRRSGRERRLVCCFSGRRRRTLAMGRIPGTSREQNNKVVAGRLTTSLYQWTSPKRMTREYGGRRSSHLPAPGPSSTGHDDPPSPRPHIRH